MGSQVSWSGSDLLQNLTWHNCENAASVLDHSRGYARLLITVLVCPGRIVAEPLADEYLVCELKSTIA